MPVVDSAPRTGLGWLRSAFDAVRERAESDGDLLGRFVHDRDEQAFGELVRRLGPTVYGVCRRHLGNTADADDAFQATFLVLSRKASTVNPPGKVAAWVYGVANLAARKLRQTRLRRSLRERAVHPLPDQPCPEKEMDSTLLPAVDEELGRLPENFRLPILMCGVRGMTVADAAAELGWPVGTVASRLSRGRAELTKRLAKRGITLGAVAVAGGWCELAAGVPPRLIEQTVAVVAGDVLPPAVAALSSEVVNVMTWSPIRRLTAGLLCASGLALAGGGGLMIQTGTAAPVPTATADAKPTLDRVKLGDVSGLLRQESVRKEIGLSDDDYKTLTEFRDGKQAEIQQQLQNDIQAQIKAQQGRGGVISIRSNSELATKLTGEMNAEYAKKVGEVVKPEGVKRLKQAVLQAGGGRTLLDRLVIRELQLTAEQEDKIDAHLGAPGSELITTDNMAKATEARDAELAAVLKVLTAEQKKKWDALVGRALPTNDLLAASPLSEESMKANMKGARFGGGVGGFQIAPAIPAVPLVRPAAPPPPPVEEKKEK
jgi:RNA polymerase sigma factor (sigma-70 family)